VYPNPNTGGFIVLYCVDISGKYLLHLYNILGQKVNSTVEFNISAGCDEIDFNLIQPSGVYVAILQKLADNHTITRKFIIVK